MASRITDVPDQYDAPTWRNIMRDLVARLAKLGSSVGQYTVTGYTETRTLDMGSATATDIGNFVATMVSDLQKAGRLGGG